jgi:uncharacterized Tic20 family protein
MSEPDSTNSTPDIKALNALSKYLVIEESPAFGEGALPMEEDRTMAMLAHPFSIVVWFWKRKESPAVEVHAKEALNMAITWMIVSFPLSVILSFMPRLIAVPCHILLNLATLAVLALFICGLIQAREGKLVRYPFNFRLIK